MATSHRHIIRILMFAAGATCLSAQGTKSVPNGGAYSTRGSDQGVVAASTATSIMFLQPPGSPSPIILMQPPDGPSLRDQVNVVFWNYVEDPASKWWTGFKTGYAQDPGAFWTAVGSTAISLLAAWEFNAAEVNLLTEITGGGTTLHIGTVELPNPGWGPGLISGAMTNPGDFYGALTDIVAGSSVNFSTAAGDESRIWPLGYNALTALKSLNDVAEKGAKSSEPQTLVDEYLPNDLGPLSDVRMQLVL